MPVQEWEGIKVQQILVDVSALGLQPHQGANNMQLISLANNTLKGMEDPPSHHFIGAWWLNNSRLLLEIDSEDAALWLGGSLARAAFLG